MGRFGFNDVDNYGNGNGGSSFFSLKNDGDVAHVRFMYNDTGDINGYAVHEVEVDGKRRYVNCIRSYNEPKSKCPFCANNNFQKAKMYIPLYDLDDEEVKIWERGKNFFAKMSSVCARYASGNTPLVAHTFDIERHGKKGDTGTTYEIYETGSDDTRLEDLPEVPDVIGTIVLDKTADDMEFFIEEGYFPNNDGAPRREERRSDDYSRRPTTSRRTPANRDSNVPF